MIKFLENGIQVDLIETLLSGKFTVRYYVADGSNKYANGEYYANTKPIYDIVDKVYDKPPAYKYDDELKILLGNIAKSQIDYTNIKKDISSISKERDDLLKKLKDVPVLKHIDTMLSDMDKFTHYIVADDYSSGGIFELDCRYTEMDDNLGYSNKKYRMVSLNVVGKKLSWELNKWDDGSGNAKKIIPCTSYEEAVELYKEFVLKNTLLKDDKGNYKFNNIGCYDKNLKKYGIEFPQDYLEQLAKRKKISNNERIVKLELELSQLKGEL